MHGTVFKIAPSTLRDPALLWIELKQRHSDGHIRAEYLVLQLHMAERCAIQISIHILALDFAKEIVHKLKSSMHIMRLI